jgi:GNAT superfamily N-acetyltransferase
MGEVSIEILTINQARQALPDLCALLIDSVEHGASVNFILPMSFEKASAFWTQRSFPGVAAQTTLLFVAKAQERLIGTVQIQFAPQENQPHRAEIAKMLVHSTARRRGVGGRLLVAAESAAVKAGRTLLVLDTEEGSDAERLYKSAGWRVIGVVPEYALTPTGRLIGSTHFYKSLSTPGTPGK